MTEIHALDQLQAPRRLGLHPDEIEAVIDEFCHDLLCATCVEWCGSAQIDNATRQALMDEVQDPQLRAQVMALCEGVALADGYLAEGEATMLDIMSKSWRMAPAPSMALRRGTLHALTREI